MVREWLELMESEEDLGDETGDKVRVDAVELVDADEDDMTESSEGAFLINGWELLRVFWRGWNVTGNSLVSPRAASTRGCGDVARLRIFLEFSEEDRCRFADCRLFPWIEFLRISPE